MLPAVTCNPAVTCGSPLATSRPNRRACHAKAERKSLVLVTTSCSTNCFHDPSLTWWMTSPAAATKQVIWSALQGCCLHRSLAPPLAYLRRQGRQTKASLPEWASQRQRSSSELSSRCFFLRGEKTGWWVRETGKMEGVCAHNDDGFCGHVLPYPSTLSCNHDMGPGPAKRTFPWAL